MLRRYVVPCVTALVLISLFILSGCASFRTETPSPLTRCQYEDNTSSVPAGVLVKSTLTQRMNDSDSKTSVQLCKIVDKDREDHVTFSWYFWDTDDKKEGVLVIWLNPALLVPSGNGVLGFVVARELNRYEQGRMCVFSGIPEYLPCEHTLDRFAMEMIGAKRSLESLLVIEELLRHGHSSPILLLSVVKRIALLLDYQANLRSEQPAGGNQEEATQPEPQSDIAKR